MQTNFKSHLKLGLAMFLLAAENTSRFAYNDGCESPWLPQLKMFHLSPALCLLSLQTNGVM